MKQSWLLCLVLPIVLLACSDPVSTGPHDYSTALETFASINCPVPLRELEERQIRIFLKSERYRLRDSLAYDTMPVHQALALLDEGIDPLSPLVLKANDVDLQRGPSNEFNFRNYTATVEEPGSGTMRWHYISTLGRRLDADIESPAIPSVPLLPAYARVSAASGFDLTFEGEPGDRQLVLWISLDSYRTVLVGGDTSSLHGIQPRPVISVQTRLDDAGSGTVPASALVGLPTNRVYTLTVHRYRYQKASATGGVPVGILAVATYDVPIFLTP